MGNYLEQKTLGYRAHHQVQIWTLTVSARGPDNRAWFGAERAMLRKTGQTMGYIGDYRVYWGNIGIMEKKMETTIEAPAM